MTAIPSQRLTEFTAETLRARLPEALGLYVAAMNYPPDTARQRAPMWLAHTARPGWRCVGAISTDGALVGICYGYQGAAGQWWHEQVRRGLAMAASSTRANQWTRDYFELTELHVSPESQGRGIGEDLLRRTLEGVDSQRVLLSTPEGPTRAWRLYRRLGFVDVLRNYQFAGDPRPFAVLGRALPL
ncbi:MAG: GNAT family N-acetyltransferase [Kutzneria sp.]|nr:GNAT family N-acetyltransferase [Kutzneria sp.]